MISSKASALASMPRPWVGRVYLSFAIIPIVQIMTLQSRTDRDVSLADVVQG